MTDLTNPPEPATNEAPPWRARPFTRLHGNVKDNFDEQLGAYNLILGRNQTGKTGRLDGIRLALLGVKGHPVGNHGSEMMALAPADADYLSAQLEGPDGLAYFKVDMKGSKVKQPEHDFMGDLQGRLLSEEDRDRVLPPIEMSAFLKLGPDLGRRALMRRFGNIVDVPEPPGMDDDMKTLWDEGLIGIQKDLAKDADASEKLAALSKWFNSRKLAEGKQFKALEQDLEERRKQLTTDAAGAEQLPSLRQQQATAKAWENSHALRMRLDELDNDKLAYRERAAPFQLSDETLQARAIDRQTQLAELQSHVDAATASIAAVDELLADLERRLDRGTFVIEIESNVITDDEGVGPCALCGSAHLPAKVIPAIEAQIVERRRQYQEAKSAHTTLQQSLSAEQQKVQQQRAAWAQKDRDDETAKSALRAEHTRIMAAEHEAKKALELFEAPTSYEGPTSVELTLFITNLETAEQARAQIEADTARQRAHRRRRDLAKELEGEAKKLLTQEIGKVQSTAEAAINKYMPEGLHAVLDLEKSAWNVIGDDGRPHNRHTMCGLEEDALLIALGCAYTEGAPLRVLLLDDKEIAGVGFENVMRFFGALKNAVDAGWITQVFIAGNRLEPMVDQLRAAGWNIIITSERAAESPHAESAVAAAAPAAGAHGAINAHMDGTVPQL